MYPDERSLVKQYKDQPFVLLGINSDPTPSKLREVEKRERMEWPNIFDGGSTEGPIQVKWGVRYWPQTYLIDHEGIIRKKDLRGPGLKQALETWVPKAIAAESEGSSF